MAKILFFNSPSRTEVYLKTNVKVGAPSYPSLTIATLAGQLIDKHKVKVIDLDFYSDVNKAILEAIKKFKPNYICASVKTPDYPVVKQIMSLIKKRFSKITTIIGGVHATACIEEVRKENCFDIIVLGEGDFVLTEILEGSRLNKIKGICYRDKKENKTNLNKPRNLIKDLNSLPYPAWHLFDLKKYKNSRLSSRMNPVGHIETSRGCSYNCNYCSKLIFGRLYRMKSVKRVVDEMEYMLESGFKEIHIADDSFTQNIERAKEICRR